MRLVECRQVFDERLLRWARNLWQSEIHGDFQRLRLIRSPVVTAFVTLLRSMSVDDRNWFIEARLKQFHATAATLLGEGLSADEAIRLRQLEDRLFGMTLPNLSSRGSSGANRRVLQQSLKSKLQAICGPVSSEWGSRDEWRHEAVFGGWHVHTYFDLGSKLRDLTYHHKIGAAPPRSFLREWISLGSVLGVSSGTEWTASPSGDEEAVAEAAAQSVSILAREWPILLEGLDPVTS